MDQSKTGEGFLIFQTGHGKFAINEDILFTLKALSVETF